MLLSPTRHRLLISIALTIILLNLAMEFDLMVPAFPLMLDYFQITEQEVQGALTLNYLGFFLTTLIGGPVADVYGRRPLMIGSTLLFVVGSALCAGAETLSSIYIGRFLQGAGVSAPIMGIYIIIADLFPGTSQTKFLGILNSTVGAAMAVAPLLGSYLTLRWGWRGSFYCVLGQALMALLFIYLCVPETLTKTVGHKARFSLRHLLQAYQDRLRDLTFLRINFSLCLSVIGYWVFMGLSSLLFVEELQVPLRHFGYYQASIIVAYSFSAPLIPLLLRRWTENQVLWLTDGLYLFIAAGVILTGYFLPDDPLLITAWMCFYCLTLGFGTNLVFSHLMNYFPDSRGATGAFYWALRMLCFAAGTDCMARAYNGRFWPIALFLGLTLVGSIVLRPHRR